MRQSPRAAGGGEGAWSQTPCEDLSPGRQVNTVGIQTQGCSGAFGSRDSFLAVNSRPCCVRAPRAAPPPRPRSPVLPCFWSKISSKPTAGQEPQGSPCPSPSCRKAAPGPATRKPGLSDPQRCPQGPVSSSTQSALVHQSHQTQQLSSQHKHLGKRQDLKKLSEILRSK